MIQSRRSQTNTTSSLPWPESFYAETDAQARLQLLTEHEASFKDPQDAIRRQILSHRYVTKKSLFRKEMVDNFMRAWMLMKVSVSMAEDRFQEEALVREWRGYQKDLLIDSVDYQSEPASQLLALEWKAFFRQYLAISLSDRTYGSGLSGTIKLDSDELAQKVAGEWQLLTQDFPEQLHMKDAFADFHQCAAQVYEESGL